MAAKRQKIAELAPPLPKENGWYKVELPFGKSVLYESHNDALRGKIAADAAIAVEREVDCAVKQWVSAMKAAALKQSGKPTVNVTTMVSISEEATDAIVDRATSQRCALASYG
jgi:hypothetical protein